MTETDTARCLDGTQLAERTVGWLVVAGLVHRAILLPVSLVSDRDLLKTSGFLFFTAAIILSVANVCLAILIVRGQRPRFLSSRSFLFSDLAIAFGGNLLLTAFLPRGSVLLPGGDAFWQYTVGTVVVWVCLRGPRFALRLLGAGIIVELAMLGMNAMTLRGKDYLLIGGRLGWIGAGLLIPAVILHYANRGAHLAAAEGRRAGQASARAEALSDMHDTVLQTLAEIARRTAERASNRGAELLVQVRELAAQEIHEMSNAIVEVDRRTLLSLDDELRMLAAESALHGLPVKVDLNRTPLQLESDVLRAIVASCRELLTNIRRHADVPTAELNVASCGTEIVIAVIDHGVGMDSASVPYRWGLQNSVMRRVGDVGGSVRIESVLGEGTRVEVRLPLKSTGKLASEPAAHRAGVDSRTSDRSLSWLAIPALTYRACLAPLQIALAVSELGQNLRASLFAIMIAVFSADLLLLYLAITERAQQLFRSRIFLVFDVVVAILINIWQVSQIPHNTALIPLHEFLWGYTYATVALWTGVKGVRVGAAVVAAGIASQFLMIVVNHAEIDVAGSLLVGTQIIKLCAALVLAGMIASQARGGLSLALSEASRSGREYERALGLRDLYDASLGALQKLIGVCDDDSSSVGERLLAARGLALSQSDLLRGFLQAASSEPPVPKLVGQLRLTVDFYRKLGLRVELVDVDVLEEPTENVASALAAALHEALANVLRHADVVHVVVRLTTDRHGAELVVRDQGRGVRNESERAMAELRIVRLKEVCAAGGTATVWSLPGEGVRVRISVPYRSASVVLS